MAGLDLNGRLLLPEVIDEQRRAGKTVLQVSHALGEVAADGTCWVVPVRQSRLLFFLAS